MEAPGTVLTAGDSMPMHTFVRRHVHPRYERRVREVNEAVVATYLAGGRSA